MRKNIFCNYITISIVIFFMALSTAQTQEVNAEHTCPAARGLPTLSGPERLAQMPQFMIPGYWTIKVLVFLDRWNPFESRPQLKGVIRKLQTLIHEDEDKGCHVSKLLKKRAMSIFDKPAGLYFFHYFASPIGDLLL